ncbi:hypothetical protein VDG1235_2197 [Verrucomicrobiia bacterium DG1235]|nr:hypothetical protein VDG1235_2197 [Verrucomicrobiae bacterium DG1235]
MILGLALIDGAQIIQLFLIGNDFPQKQLIVFVLCIFGAAQFAPFYASKIVSADSAQMASPRR